MIDPVKEEDLEQTLPNGLRGTSPADTSALGFQPPELGEKRFLQAGVLCPGSPQKTDKVTHPQVLGVPWVTDSSAVDQARLWAMAQQPLSCPDLHRLLASQGR